MKREALQSFWEHAGIEPTNAKPWKPTPDLLTSCSLSEPYGFYAKIHWHLRYARLGSRSSTPHKTALQIMRPALGMREPALLRVAFVGPVAPRAGLGRCPGSARCACRHDPRDRGQLVIARHRRAEVAPFILPVPLRPALIGVSSMALTRLWRSTPAARYRPVRAVRARRG
jgi:hypothetical protein